MKAWGAITIAVLLAACEKGGGAGKERGACYGNGTCDPGLVCLSEVCVRPPPADCGKVAEKLASYRLGNYAPREERAQVVADLTSVCEQARLSVDEGNCILEAKGRMEIAKCPRPLLDELAGDKDGCKAVADTVARFFVDAFSQQGGDRAKIEKFAPEIGSAIGESCVEDLWPEAAKRCFTEAGSFDQMGDCQDSFPPELEERVENRLRPLIERVMKAVMDGGGAAPTTPPAVAPPPPPPTTTPTFAPPPPGAIPATVQAACGGYLARMERFVTCDAIPQASRDAARQGLDAMKGAWPQAGAMPAEAVQAMNDACTQAEAALAQSMTAMGCP